MPPKLSGVIQRYVEASNAHDVEATLACFAGDGTVRDENETLHGKDAIEAWIRKTIEKYRFQFKPVSAQEGSAETVAEIEITGIFPGSPITLTYHFAIKDDKIALLTIDS